MKENKKQAAKKMRTISIHTYRDQRNSSNLFFFFHSSIFIQTIHVDQFRFFNSHFDVRTQIAAQVLHAFIPLHLYVRSFYFWSYLFIPITSISKICSFIHSFIHCGPSQLDNLIVC